MKNLVKLSIISVLAMAQFSLAEEIIIGTNAKPGNPKVNGAKVFNEILKVSSKGKYDMNIAHSATLGDDRQMLKSTKLGTMHITINSAGTVSEIVPEVSAFGLPYLFNSLPEAWEVLDGPVGDELEQKLEDKGYIVLAWWDNGMRKVSHKSKAIATVEDIQGMKIRTPQDQITIDAFTALGANPAPLAFSELPAALQTGVFEGQENPLANIYSSNLHELTPYIAKTNHKYEMAPILASKRWWDKLSEEDQELIKESAEKAGWYNRGAFLISDVELEQTMKEEGVKFNDIDTAQFKEKTKGVYDDFEKQVGGIVTRIQESVESVRGN